MSPSTAAPPAVNNAAPLETKAMTEAEKLVAEGDKHFSEGNYLKAAASYMKATKKDPTNALVQCNLSYALLKECKYHKALTAADAAVKIEPELEQAHFRKGLAHAALEQWEESITSLMAAQRLQAGSATKEVSDMIAMAKWQCKKAHLEEDTPVPEICKDAKKPEEPKKEEEKEKTEEESREELTKKLAAMQAAKMNGRTKKFNKKVMQKAAGEITAAKQLVTKEMIAQTKAALEKDKDVMTKANELSTEAKLEEKKKAMKEGDNLPYDSERVARFVAAELKDLTAAGSRESYKEPVAVVLPGVHKAEWGDEGQGISLWNAFQSVERYNHMTKFMIKFVEDSGAHAAMMITPKDKVSYPTLTGSLEFLKKEGYVVQLQAKDKKDCAVWFVEVTAAGEAGTAHQLEDAADWVLLPNVFNPESLVREISQKKKDKDKKKGKGRK